MTKSHIQIHKNDDIYQTLKSFQSSNSNQNKSNSNYVQLIFDPEHSNENTNSLKKKPSRLKSHKIVALEKLKIIMDRVILQTILVKWYQLIQPQ